LHYFTQAICWLCPFFFMLVLSCTPLQVKEGVFSPSHGNYTVDLPEKDWEPVRTGKEDIALWHKQHHAMIAIISSDIENKAFSLEMLNGQLFIGMKNKKILLKESALVDNQEAMHTILICEIDNHTFKVESYVIKIENRVYDLLYWAPFDSFDNAREDFVNVINSFKTSTP